MEEGPALYTNRVDIWAMGCILYELATGNRPFKSDWAVSSYIHSAKSMEVPLDDTFNVDSIKIITKHIVDMLQATPTVRPSAAILSTEFDRHLQLPQESVQLSAVSNSVSTLAITEEIEPPPVDMLQATPLARPSASILSTEFDRQLQLAQESVRLNAVSNSVSTLAITEETEQTPAKLLKAEVVTESEAALVVNSEAKQTSSTLHGDIVGSNSPGDNAQPLPPHLRGMSLYGAAVNGDLDAVKALITAKRDVNAQGGHLGNPLQAASRVGFEAVVRLLLEKGADVNAQGGLFGNALQAASRKGSEAVVRLLLEKGAEVNAQGGSHGTALQAASRNGSEAVVRLLLEKGAEVNAQGGEYGSALRAASKNGNFAVMKLLKANGAKHPMEIYE